MLDGYWFFWLICFSSLENCLRLPWDKLLKHAEKNSASNGARAMARTRARCRARALLWTADFCDFKGQKIWGFIMFKIFLALPRASKLKKLSFLYIILRSHAFWSNSSIFGEIWIFNIFWKKRHFWAFFSKMQIMSPNGDIFPKISKKLILLKMP